MLDEKYGNLVSELAFQRQTISKCSLIFFILARFYRRGFQALVILIFYKSPVAQVILTMIINLAYLILLLNLNVFRTQRQYSQELLNESVTFCTVYFLFIFTGFFVTNASPLHYMGLAMLSLTGLNFLINLLPIFFDFTKGIRLRYRRWKQKRAMNLKRKAVIYAQKEEKARSVDQRQSNHQVSQLADEAMDSA